MNFETAEVTYEKPHRLSGILLHPTSCPSPYGIGDLGQDAYDFVDFLEKSGQHLMADPPTYADRFWGFAVSKLFSICRTAVADQSCTFKSQFGCFHKQYHVHGHGQRYELSVLHLTDCPHTGNVQHHNF